MTELTGRSRYRSERRWGRERLILQVEVAARDYDHRGGGNFGPAYTRWRDATTEDLSTSDKPTVSNNAS